MPLHKMISSTATTPLTVTMSVTDLEALLVRTRNEGREEGRRGQSAVAKSVQSQDFVKKCEKFFKFICFFYFLVLNIFKNF